MEERRKREYFTRISNRTLENLARVKLSPNEWQTVMALVRKTYGYRKAKDQISLSQFQLITELDRKRQSAALKSLTRKKIILKEAGYISSYSLNKDYAGWMVAAPPPVMTPEDASKLAALRSKVVAPEGRLLVAGPPYTIDNTIYIVQENKKLQNNEPGNISLASASSDTDNTAFANAPAESVINKVQLTEDTRKEHPAPVQTHAPANIPPSGAGCAQETATDNNASTITASAEPAIAKKLRSFAEIRKEHPDAEREYLKYSKKFYATWEELGKWKSEDCL